MAFVAVGSARGITSSGPLMLGSRAVAASELSSLPGVKGDESLSKTILPAAQKSTVAQLFVAASAQDGKEDAKGKGDDEKEKKPPPRSKRCPPDDQKDDHRDKDHRDDKCGKGDDSKNSVVSH